MKKFDQDVYAGGVILALCALFFFFSFDISNKNDAALFPRILIGIMVVLGIWISFEGLKKTKAENGDPKPKITLKNIRIPAVCYLYMVAYIVLYILAGYVIATAVFLFAFMHYLHVKSWKVKLLVAAGFLVMVYIIFDRIFYVNILQLGKLGQFLANM